MATLNDVRRIARALPGTSEECTKRGWAAWIVSGKFFVWERPLLKSDLSALGDLAPKGPVLATPHFDGYPAVLVRLDKIVASKLKDVIVEAWLARAPKRAVEEFLQGNKGPKKPAKRKQAR